MESTTYKKARFFAIVLHAGLFVTLIVFSAMNKSSQDKPHVFTMVSDTPPVPPTPTTTTQPKKAAPTPKPTAPAAPKKLSYQDFVKKRGAPKPIKKKAPAAPKPQTVQAPKLDFSDIAQSITNIEFSASHNTTPALAAKLKALIDSQWDAPESEYYSATVEFSIDKAGTINILQFITCSGSASFDSSIEEALAKIKGTPMLKDAPGTYQMRFSMKSA